MNEIKRNLPSIMEDKDLNSLVDSIAHMVNDAKTHLAQTVNITLVQTNWNIGKYIVEFEQQGNAKAKYGTGLLTSLAKLLRIKLGKGYSRPSLYCMRCFYLLYPIFQTLSGKLSWSHICELITIDDDLERSFYEKECISENWNVRSLRRQKIVLCISVWQQVKTRMGFYNRHTRVLLYNNQKILLSRLILWSSWAFQIKRN